MFARARHLAAGLGLVALAGTGLGIGLAGCASGGQQTPLASTPRVPAATGQVDTKVTDNGNTQFNIKVEHLAPPDRVANGTNSYVVWVRPLASDQPPQNMGALQVDPDRLTGRFSGTTPYRQFQLSITAEQDTTTTSPSQNQVLSAMVSQGGPPK